MIDNRSYEVLLHAMQAGVALDHSNGGKDGSSKHLRVGVNAAMSDQGGLVTLLIEKGIITEEEYLEAIRQAMAREVARYEQYIKKHYGLTVTLDGIGIEE